MADAPYKDLHGNLGRNFRNYIGGSIVCNDERWFGIACDRVCHLGIDGSNLRTFFGVFALYDYSKARSFVRHYKNFKQYETVLDSPETSYWYRGAIYYNVRIKDDNTSVLARTNACFSGMLFSKFTLEDYNNKNVVGLLDPESERFYVVKKVN